MFVNFQTLPSPSSSRRGKESPGIDAASHARHEVSKLGQSSSCLLSSCLNLSLSMLDQSNTEVDFSK